MMVLSKSDSVLLSFFNSRGAVLCYQKLIADRPEGAILGFNKTDQKLKLV